MEEGGKGTERKRKERDRERETGTDRLEIAQPQATSSSRIHNPYLDVKLYLN